VRYGIGTLADLSGSGYDNLRIFAERQ
jgi:hypothetical protein